MVGEWGLGNGEWVGAARRRHRPSTFKAEIHIPQMRSQIYQKIGFKTPCF